MCCECCCSVPKSCPTLCSPMKCSTPGFPILHHLVKFAQTLSQWCYPTISSSVAPFSFCRQSFLTSRSFPMSWSSPEVAKILELQFQHQSFQWIFRLVSFRVDQFDLLAIQGALKSLPIHNSEAQILRHSAFFMVQLLHRFMITGETMALTIQTFVGKVISLLFNPLSRFVIGFLPGNKCLLISWVQSPSAVILEPQKIKVCHCFHCFPMYLPWSHGTRCHDLTFLNVEF